MNYGSPIPLDTRREAFFAQTDVLRTMGSTRRGAMTFELNEQMLKRVAAGVRMRHPEYDDEQVRLATIRVRLGDEWFQKAFPSIEIEP